MNQILKTSSNEQPESSGSFENTYPDNFSKKKKKASFLKIQFILSVSLALTFLVIYGINFYTKQQNEKISQRLMDSFNLANLYSYSQNTTEYETQRTSNQNESTSIASVVGAIEIPKINIDYPILSIVNDELLKISPCRFYGPLPNKIGNVCIAGHNYGNDKFFSNLSSLTIGDTIRIYDSKKNRIEYTVFSKSEIASYDTSCTFQETNGKREVTLVTCNNKTGNRIVVKATEKNK